MEPGKKILNQKHKMYAMFMHHRTERIKSQKQANKHAAVWPKPFHNIQILDENKYKPFHSSPESKLVEQSTVQWLPKPTCNRGS